MHTIIRLVSLMVLIALLAQPSWLRVAVTLLVATIFISTNRVLVKSVVQMCWRLKWFYLSLIISFGWFSPGDVIVVTTLISDSYLPTQQGLLQGFLRVLVMASIVTWVTIVMKSCTREELVAGVIWLSRPVVWSRIGRERFALRLVMTLEYVSGAQKMIKQQLDVQRERGFFARIGSTLTDILSAVETRLQSVATNNVISETVRTPVIKQPPLWQWLWPAVLLISFQFI